MPAVGEVHPRRMTVDDLVRRFGVGADADSAEVTFTSIARHSGDVRPGCLFVPEPAEQDVPACRAALLNGAYAILLPSGGRYRQLAQVGLPILTVKDQSAAVGPIAAYLNGDPSKAIAVFVVEGPRCDAIARRLGGLLHHLGNPVGLVVSDGASSLGRPLDTHGVLNGARLQFLEAIMAEDGVTALVIAASHAILDPDALAGTQIDVLFEPDSQTGNKAGEQGEQKAAPKGGHVPAHDTDEGHADARTRDDTRSLPSVGPSTDAASHGPVFGARLPVSACISASPADATDPRFDAVRPVLDFDPVTASALQMAVDAGISVEAIARAERVAREFEPQQDGNGPSDGHDSGTSAAADRAAAPQEDRDGRAADTTQEASQ